MAASAPTRSLDLNAPPEAHQYSTISVMPNSARLSSRNIDMNVAGRDMHSPSGTATSNISLTFNLGGCVEPSDGGKRRRAQGELDRASGSLVSSFVELISRFPFFSISAKPKGHATKSDTSITSIDESERSTTNDALSLPYHEVYVHTLLAEKLGLPCWEPRPLDPPNQPRGVIPGDVGTYTIEGGFAKIFNLWDDKGAICDISARLGSHIGCQGLNEGYRPFPDWLRGGDAIAHGACVETPSKSAPSERSHIEVLYEFHCDSPSGAILALPTSADKDEVNDLAEVEDYLRVHAAAIYIHACATRSIGKETSLCVVTGCIKSSSWAMAAYKGEMNPNHNTLELVSISPSPAPSNGGDTPSPDYKWTRRGSARARWDKSKFDVKDQSLFLLGFKLAFSPGFRARVEHVKGQPGSDQDGSRDVEDDSDPGPSHPPKSNQPDSTSQGNGSTAQPSQGQGCTPRQCHEKALTPLPLTLTSSSAQGNTGDEINCTPFPTGPHMAYHPSDVINSHILEQLGCDIAICHDSSWHILWDLPSSPQPVPSEAHMPDSLKAIPEPAKQPAPTSELKRSSATNSAYGSLVSERYGMTPSPVAPRDIIIKPSLPVGTMSRQRGARPVTNIGGKAEWHPDARGFNVEDPKIVHHRSPQGTKEHVGSYTRSDDFTSDTPNIRHYDNGGMSPPPPNRPDHDGSPTSPHGGHSRPTYLSPPSAPSDSAQQYVAKDQTREKPSTQYRPSGRHLQHISKGRGPLSAPDVKSKPNFWQNVMYGSRRPGDAFPSGPLKFGASVANGDTRTKRAPQEGDERDEEIWQMSDDEDAEPVDHSIAYTAENVFLPRLLEFMAMQAPSCSLSDVELLSKWYDLVEPSESASEAEIIATVKSGVDAWRTGFIEKALQYLDERISPQLGHDVPDREARQRWAQSMKPDGKKKPPYPFYFKDPVAKQGSFMSDFITFTLSHHLKAVSVLPRAKRLSEFPLGALALTLIACEQAIDIWANETRSPGSYGFRGPRFRPDVWELVRTQLNGKFLRKRKIFEAATRQVQQAGGSSTTLGSSGH